MPHPKTFFLKIPVCQYKNIFYFLYIPFDISDRYWGHYPTADFDFIRSYCWGHLEDFMLSENGTVLGKSSNIISYLKLYPYALFSASMVGAITRNFSKNFKWKYTEKNFENHLSLLWTLSTTQRASRVAFTIFAIEEAVAELLSNLRKCPKKKSYKKSAMVMTTEIEDSQIRAWSLWYDREIQYEFGCLWTPSTSADFIY